MCHTRRVLDQAGPLPLRYHPHSMKRPAQLDTTRHLARAARTWLFWLALALAAAHSIAAWHTYTHSPAEEAAASHDKSAGDAACALCLAVAGIGGAAPGPSLATLHLSAADAPLPAYAAPEQPATPRRPYAIRAPPLLLS